jgi:hypothetical protein
MVIVLIIIIIIIIITITIIIIIIIIIITITTITTPTNLGVMADVTHVEAVDWVLDKGLELPLPTVRLEAMVIVLIIIIIIIIIITIIIIIIITITTITTPTNLGVMADVTHVEAVDWVLDKGLELPLPTVRLEAMVIVLIIIIIIIIIIITIIIIIIITITITTITTPTNLGVMADVTHVEAVDWVLDKGLELPLPAVRLEAMVIVLIIIIIVIIVITMITIIIPTDLGVMADVTHVEAVDRVLDKGLELPLPAVRLEALERDDEDGRQAPERQRLDRVRVPLAPRAVVLVVLVQPAQSGPHR